jgi:hypothetical protein
MSAGQLYLMAIRERHPRVETDLAFLALGVLDGCGW